ncbi:hypothetical protein [Membranihabitans maritimus]|uniref:hypothetical protein n=1 Tax=Membranihabitans maritimus TaxID=2904244 RepID=UPI001F3E73B5|nr:hypothetical protein [Membranihabitans maritimus]
MDRFLKYLCCLFLLGFSLEATSQAIRWPKPEQPSKQEIFTKTRQVNLKLSPVGFQLGYSFGTIPNFYTNDYFQFEIGQIRHPKELSSGIQALKSSISRGFYKNYSYGKQNSFYTLRASKGKRVYLSEKGPVKSVQVGYTYRYGISAGLLKPYYIQVVEETDGFFGRDFEHIKYTEENREKFLNDEDIFGKSPFRYGLGEMQFTPGIHAQGGLVFDWGQDPRTILSTEVGLMLDFYFSSIPLMVDQSDKPFFLNFYVALQFGRRQ